jgi:hypothetical protein
MRVIMRETEPRAPVEINIIMIMRETEPRALADIHTFNVLPRAS